MDLGILMGIKEILTDVLICTPSAASSGGASAVATGPYIGLLIGGLDLGACVAEKYTERKSKERQEDTNSGNS